MDKTRRTLISAALAATALPVLPATTSSSLRAVSFDGIALFDPRPVEAIAREALGDKTAAFMALWRSRQFEYTWLRNVMNRYADFEQVTAEALLFAQKTLGVTLDDAMRTRLVRQFFDLRAWPDVKPTLEELRRLGYPVAIMSNFTEAMLQNAIRNSGLEGIFDAVLSTDRVGVYKPDARAYATAVSALSQPPERICFVAFAGWDVSGAKAFGHRVYWANRAGGMNEELGVQPDFISKDLAALPGFLQSS